MKERYIVEIDENNVRIIDESINGKRLSISEMVEKLNDLKDGDYLSQCKTCSHMQVWDNETDQKCSYYHNVLCEVCNSYCKGTHYMNVDDGLSVFALRSWLNRLTKEEMERPIIVVGDFMNMIPIKMMRYVEHGVEMWALCCKYE